MNKIKFTKLFGRFDYEIELKKDGITILTGPNGFGKSTILRCINAIQNKVEGLIYFINLDFEKIEFIFENDSVLVKKDADKISIDNSYFSTKDVLDKILKTTYRYNSYFRYYGSEDIFFDRRTGKEYTTEEVMSDSKILREVLENVDLLEKFFTKTLINKLERIKEKIGDIFFIKEQRLITNVKTNSRHEAKIINKIDELPGKLKKQIGDVSEIYSKVANELDSTYPYRLFNEKERIVKSEYEKNMKGMKEKFKKLKEYQIYGFNSSGKLEFKEEFATALKIYFDDFSKKYEVYEGLITKLDLFVGIINSRLTFKKIKVSREEGIEIFSNENKKLKLSELSSGEQQQIVLFYELIFETPERSLLLIDEPEISLHIIWQKTFMEDLQKVVNMKNLNVIVATHSPQIINNYWDNQIDLGELYGN